MAGVEREVKEKEKDPKRKRQEKRNKSYFDSYSDFGIHREMLGDKVAPL